MMPSMAFQLSDSRRLTALIDASLSQSITRASNRAVNPEPSSAPGNIDLRDTVLRAAHPRYLGNQDSLVLTRVQMSPAPLALVVARARLLAVWTHQLRRAPSRHEHVDLAGLNLQVDFGDMPR